jgi:hypothetical protein
VASDNREGPPFKPYTRFPNWFYWWCMPKLSPPASNVWQQLWMRFRWAAGTPVYVSVRALSRVCGVSCGVTERSITELEGHELLKVIQAPSRRRSRGYVIPVYTAEQARVRFKNMEKRVFGKMTHSSVQNSRTQTPSECAEFPNTVKDYFNSVQ